MNSRSDDEVEISRLTSRSAENVLEIVFRGSDLG